MALKPSALTLLTTLKGELRLTDDSQDEVLERLIHAQSARLVHLLGRKALHYQEGLIERVEGEGTPDLKMSYAPITAITEIALVGGADATAIEAIAQVVDERWIERIDGGIFGLTSMGYGLYGHPVSSTQRSLWQVTLNAGYVTPRQAELDVELEVTLPHDIEEAALALCVQAYTQRGRDMTIKSEKLLEGSISYAVGADAAALPGVVLSVVAAHRWVL